MRTLEECRAEVFRRSNGRIQARKRTHNRVVAWCVPIVLCITLWSVTILPAMMPAGKEAPESDQAPIGNVGGLGSLVCSYTEVEIQTADGTVHRVTDKVKVTQLFSYMFALYDVDGTDQTTEEQLPENFAGGSATGNADSHTVIFATAEGDQTIYSLTGNTLTNQTTGEKLVLADEQLSEFHTVFELRNEVP